MLHAYLGVIYMGDRVVVAEELEAGHWIPYMQLIRGPLL